MMRASHSAHAFLLLLLAGVAIASGNKGCHPGDKAALLAIKAALGNPYHFASWTPASPCCDWYDIDCDPSTGRVVGLSVFQDANLTGAIPDAVAGLTHLQTLVLHHLPVLSGPIPPAIARLTNLSRLTISWTAVSGPVPSFLGALTRLTMLDLSFNSLTGAIPPELASLSNLFSIDISRNRLTGTLPPQLFSKLSAATRQEAAAYLRLSRNNLTGSIPAEFAATSLTEVDLSRNALSFDMSGLRLPGGLSSLDVSHNMIYGSILAAPQVARLQLFNVSYNRLCGEVPSAAARFDVYSFQHNKCLCGAPLPPCK